MSEESRQARKKRIRSAFSQKGKARVIPADPAFTKEQEEREESVGIYVRVSTTQDAQAESIETQEQVYREMVAANPKWKLYAVYKDDGKSGTSIKRRKGFQQMIADCKAGKISLIITKAVSRFARNTTDCVNTCRALKRLNPPVSVWFQNANLNTGSSTSELMLTLLAVVAQEESETKSTSISWAIRSRFEHDIPRIVELFGFDVVEEDVSEDECIQTLRPNKDAEVVRQIYNMAEDGFSIVDISMWLAGQGIPSPKGKPLWSCSTLRYILTNERYCGDVISQKTLVIDPLEHISVRNIGQLPRYEIRDRHEAIVPRAQWERVQFILGAWHPYGEVIEDGPFSGFMPVVAPPEKDRKGSDLHE